MPQRNTYTISRGLLRDRLREVGKNLSISLLQKLYGPLLHFLHVFDEERSVFLFPFFVDYALCAPVPHFNYAVGDKTRYRLGKARRSYVWRELSPASVFWTAVEATKQKSFRRLAGRCYLGNHTFDIDRIIREYGRLASLIGKSRNAGLAGDVKYLDWLKDHLNGMLGYRDLLALSHRFLGELQRVLSARLADPWIMIVPPQRVYGTVGFPCVFNLLKRLEGRFEGAGDLQIMDEFVNEFIRCHVRDYGRIQQWVDYNVYSSDFLHCPFRRTGLRYNCDNHTCQGEIPNRCASGEACSFERYLKEKMGIRLSQIISRY